MMLIKLNDGETCTVTANHIQSKSYTFMMVGGTLMVRKFEKMRDE